MKYLDYPEKVSAIMSMSEDVFQQYKYALLKENKIELIKRG